MRNLVGCCSALVLGIVLAGPLAAAPPTPVLGNAMKVPVLEVLDPRGSVTVASVSEAVGKLERELSGCADDARWSGDALVWMITDWRGKPQKVEVGIEKPAVERCLIRVLKRVVVAKAHSRATSMMRLQFEPAIVDGRR